MSQNNQTNPNPGSNTGVQGKQSYPLDNYTVQPKNDSSGEESPFYKSQAPTISMPKGGGALKGIDEKFSVNAVNGTASLSIPLPLTPGRAGFTPALSLSYNSGGGNSEFGLGWGSGLPAIQRKTDKKLPQYNDAEETDIFLLAGSEDLVPMLNDGIVVEFTTGFYHVRRYIPRIEGLFARIEWIHRQDSTDSWWRVTTKENITTWYGLTPAGRISDPKFPANTFKWLPQISIDNKGNAQEFFYVAENTDNVPYKAHERNRKNGISAFANKYLKKISYCNKNSFFITDSNAYEPSVPTGAQYMMEAIFDYGDHSGDVPAYIPDQMWACRKDPFSDFHAGFEIRTWRQCRRMIMFHNFAELGDGTTYVPVPVRSLDVVYWQDSQTDVLTEADFIVQVSQAGYKKKPDGSGYYKKTLPPMTMEYQPLSWNTTIQKVDLSDVSGAPQGLTGSYQWTDLYGEGISGILTETATGWYYKSNLGNGHFGAALPVAQKPSLGGLGKIMQWQDLDADGRRQLVSHDPSMPGYFELDDNQQWQPFRQFNSIANIDWNSPWTKMMDLDGDGRPDVLITDENVWTWWTNKGTQGYTEGGKRSTFWDEEKGPRLLINDPVQSVFLADMNGDGLTDLVRIKNGEVCYWPNMGYGKFGAKVTMSNAPVFATPDLYNPQYLHLADISGTGAPDLLYRSPDSITAWVNLAGNGWSAPVRLGTVPSVENQSTIAVIDFLGNGTGSIVWSSPLPQHSNAPMYYIDLMGGNKPYVLKSYRNGMGKHVTLQHKSSTQYYLEDKAAGTPWATKLPFPVQCLSHTTTHDHVSNTTYTQSYSYHHGYYDHEEREFRGFGRVDSIDIDNALYVNQHNGTEAIGMLNQFPVLTKTWFHTGAWMRDSTLLDKYATEFYPLNDHASYYQLPALKDILSMPAKLSVQEVREAHRALKGSALRQEVYALDNTSKKDIPYTVTMSGYKVQAYQPLARNRYASFLALQEQSIAWSCERTPIDARIQHSMTLSTDELGNVLESAQVAYPRHGIPGDLPDLVKEAQGKMYITYSTHQYTNDIETTSSYRKRVPCEAISYEFHVSPNDYPGGLFTLDSFGQILPDVNNAVDYGAPVAETDTALRKLSHTRTIFREDDAATVAPLYTLHALAIPDQQYTLAFTDVIIAATLNKDIQRLDNNNEMLSQAGYLHHSDISAFADAGGDWWWLPSGTAQYSSSPAADFYQPATFTDPWNNVTTVNYWPNYHLLPQSITDALGNTSTVISYDWRGLQPTRMQDPNLNYTEMLYDALGMQVAMAVKGKDSSATEADELLFLNGDAFDADTASDISNQHKFWTNPADSAKDLLGRATWRCLYDFTVQPTAVAMIGREEHYINNPDSNVLIRITYTDGLGRIAMHKVQAADGPLPALDDNWQSSPPGDYASPPETDDSQSLTRWIGSGKTVYNNKGNAVMQFEPYFSKTHAFDPAQQAALCGVSPRIHYDALGRAYLTEMPDGTYSYTTWDDWTQTIFDANDTAMASSWYKARIGGDMGDNERDAARKTEAFWHTPTTMYLDTLARPCYTITMDSNSTEIHSAVQLDIAGDRLAIIDGTGLLPIHRVQLQYAYNMLKAPLWQTSIDGGTQHMLVDVAGQPFYTWDAAERRSHVVYDELRRPLRHELSLYQGSNSWDTARYLSVTSYGESATPISGTIEAHNLRGQAVNTKDGSGMHWVDSFDFKGMPVQSFMSLLSNAALRDADWYTLNPGSDLSTEVFTTTATVDALGRPVSVTDPSGNITQHTYDKDGALKTVVLNGDTYVQDIHHDAKGQREAIWYGNGTKTRYTYDPFTYRLTRLFTVNLNTNDSLQDLRYTYDAVGNITRIEDKALPTVFYNNSMIEPIMDYTYDALYRLIQASGREMINSNSTGSTDRYNDLDMMINATPKWDGSALQNYTQTYRYDAAGNILELQHNAGNGSYTRTFNYDSSNNYLRSVDVGGSHYDYYNNGNGYDPHGNMLQMPHLSTMEWDLSNQFCHSATGDADTYYQYSGGQRVRKYTAKTGGTEQRIYLGNFEIYRTFDTSSSLTLERTTVHISDDTGRIAMLEVRTQDPYGIDDNATSLKRFSYSNHLGSSTLELDENARIISYEEYHPYGTTAYQALNSDIKAVAKRYRFTGKERDEENGFYYHGARYYAPWLCRWTAVDPLESERVTLSPYDYCSNNPIMRHDPDGMKDTSAQQKKKTHAIAEKDRKDLEHRAEKAGMSYLIPTIEHLTDRNAIKIHKKFGELLHHSSKAHHKSSPKAKTGPPSHIHLPAGANDELKGELITYDKMIQLFPSANKEILKGFVNDLNKYGKQFGITTKNLLAHYLAQAAHESGAFQKKVPVEGSIYSSLDRVGITFGTNTDVYRKVEANPHRYLKQPQVILNAAYAHKGGNGDEASGDGFLYRGRGYFQLTLHDNYRDFTKAYNSLFGAHEDFVTNPEKVATDKEIAVISSLWYFQKYTIPAIEDGKSFRQITKTINAKALGLAERETYYDQIIKSLN
ncbi:SpvB/TcaC N-terminal domain-containing protein [Chitinophagaceae bacterium MMS25-I14]